MLRSLLDKRLKMKLVRNLVLNVSLVERGNIERDYKVVRFVDIYRSVKLPIMGVVESGIRSGRLARESNRD
jgi:hypothetical protein